jgi:thiamine transport system ATP-binding protein
MSPMLNVSEVTVRFGKVTALDRASLEVAGGEVVALLGPSGSGKSTLLRVIAGLVVPDQGRVSFDGSDLAGVPVHLRRFGLMFQSYALFPHLDVAGNVGFGLRMNGLDGEAIAERVAEVLRWVGMEELAGRRIDGLSGGEQQRVALARTLAPAPRLVMLDEPVGSLDRQLRRRLVGEIKELLSRQHTTAIYVTHDHEEAAEVAQRVAVMRAGRVVQVAPYSELVDSPADAWVAGFISG